MKFEPLAQYIEENIAGLKRGTTLFINNMPATATFGVLLKDSFAGTEIDGEIPHLRRGRFHLAVRGQDYGPTLALAESVSALLTITGMDFEGMTVKSIRPINEPVPYMPSIGNLVEFSVNFSAVYGIVAE